MWGARALNSVWCPPAAPPAPTVAGLCQPSWPRAQPPRAARGRGAEARGWGAERAGIEAYLEVKHVCLGIGAPPPPA